MKAMFWIWAAATTIGVVAGLIAHTLGVRVDEVASFAEKLF